MSSPTDDPAPLELDRVSLRYATDRRAASGSPALDDVSLRVGAGERVAVVGPSGAGKSTVLALANTSLAPTSGSVRVFGQDPVSLGPGELRALRVRVGTIHQQLHLAGPLRVVHNVNAGHLGRWSPWRAWRSLLRPLGVDDARAALDSLGIADKLWERTDNLSGGERQRVAIARVLVQNAELVLADEPISALDPTRGREVLDALCGVAAQGGRSLLVSLHAFDLAMEYFDRVIGLRAGRVVFDRPPADIGADDAAALYRIDQAPR
ncbi:MAG: phosphonate ABC transporter ATP-binding protein [Acidimicrobiales bacterium]